MDKLYERSWELFDEEREKLNRFVIEAVRAKQPANSDKILKQNAVVHSAYVDFKNNSFENIN